MRSTNRAQIEIRADQLPVITFEVAVELRYFNQIRTLVRHFGGFLLTVARHLIDH